VRPLLTTGLDAMADQVRAWDGEGSLPTAVHRAGELGVDPRHVDALRQLVMLTQTEPGLRAVWLETHYEAEVLLCRLVAESTGRPADELSLRLHVGMFNLAMRIAVEDWARRGDGSGGAGMESLTGAVISTIGEAARTLED
jgi:hypothetical protein